MPLCVHINVSPAKPSVLRLSIPARTGYHSRCKAWFYVEQTPQTAKRSVHLLSKHQSAGHSGHTQLTKTFSSPFSWAHQMSTPGSILTVFPNKNGGLAISMVCTSSGIARPQISGFGGAGQGLAIASARSQQASCLSRCSEF